MKYKKNTVVLTLSMPVDTAVSILGRLWAKGVLSDKQYEHKLSQVDARYLAKQKKKQKKLAELVEKASVFYESLRK